MLFNSLTFLIFLPIVFGLYWFVCNRSLRLQNFLIVVVSYVFYGWWDWRFLGLIAFISTWAYVFGLFEIERKSLGWSKFRLALSLVINLGILGVFKYLNFFADSLEGLLNVFGCHVDFPTLNIILPVGISFYTFQALSYTIDVYFGKIKPTRDIIGFFAFISFFPQLVAGPIERATNLLPQFQRTRQFNCDAAMHGLCLMVYGLFKKMVVADTLAIYVDSVFLNPSLYNSAACVIGALFFTLQIYCDFSGYSDCARGIARLFGFRLMVNFDRPYLAQSFADFWRRWHISLSSWFKDYVYIPLGGSRCSLIMVLRNTWVVFLLSGLWHGASWTFIGWGALHALFLTREILWKRLRKSASSAQIEPHTMVAVLRGLSVFAGVAFAWIFFRARTFTDLSTYLKRIVAFDVSGGVRALFAGQGPMVFGFCLAATALLAVSYLAPRDCAFKTLRGQMVYILLGVAVTIFLSAPSGGEFIYFQF